MRKTLIVASLSVLATPALAWQPITLYNRTDSARVNGVLFQASGVQPVGFFLYVPKGAQRTFGPLQEDGGPCLRYLSVQVQSPQFTPPIAAMTATTQFDVCRETWIVVSGTWPDLTRIGTAPLKITHGGPLSPPR